MGLVEILEQEEMWYGQDGFPYRIEDMEQSHRINVVNFLKRRAQNIYLRHQWAEFMQMYHAPQDVFDSWMSANMYTINDDPEEWLMRRPLIQALQRAIAKHNTIDGEVVSESKNQVDIRTMAKHPAGPNRFA